MRRSLVFLYPSVSDGFRGLPFTQHSTLGGLPSAVTENLMLVVWIEWLALSRGLKKASYFCPSDANSAAAV